jgi:hypothetical protein
MQCTKCGAEVLPTGICSSCGHNAHVDLEIAAFMTPHINRARIVLVAVGLLYAYIGWSAYGDIAEVKRMLERYGDDPDYDTLRSAVTTAYAIVVYVMVAGVANIILAIIAGKKTLLAFNIAGAIFLIHTGLQMWAAGGLFITSWVWWVTAISLAMGYTAATKAERLRRGTPPGPSAAF